MFCLLPAGVIWLCRRFSVLNKIGPIMILYGVGMVIGNLPFMPEQMKVLQDIIPSAAIPLAIPMMLFCCSFSKREMGLQIKLIFMLCCAEWKLITSCMSTSMRTISYSRY